MKSNLLLIAALLAACAVTEYGPAKWGWSGELARPYGAECFGQNGCNYYWCPQHPCPETTDGGTTTDSGTTQPQ